MDYYKTIRWPDWLTPVGSSSPTDISHITWVTDMDICLQQRTRDHDLRANNIAFAFNSAQFFNPRFIDPFCAIKKVYLRYPKLRHLIIVIPQRYETDQDLKESECFRKPETPPIDSLYWSRFDEDFYFPDTSGGDAVEISGFPTDANPADVLIKFLKAKQSRQDVSINNENGLLRHRLEQLSVYFVESLESCPQIIPWPEGPESTFPKPVKGLESPPIPLLDMRSCLQRPESVRLKQTALAFDSYEIFAGDGLEISDHTENIRKKYPKVVDIFIVVPPVPGEFVNVPARAFKWVSWSEYYLPSKLGRPFDDLHRRSLVPGSWSKLQHLCKSRMSHGFNCYFVKLRSDNGRLTFELLQEKPDASGVS